jgi:putative addiction module component (TIGR02574 family)
MEKKLINELSQLNKNEKLLLVEALWDSIASDPDHHKSILEQRLQTLEEEKKWVFLERSSTKVSISRRA